MLFLALPALIDALWLAGRLFLPYQIVVYGQEILKWLTVALRALREASWVLLRFVVTNPTAQASLGFGALAGAASVMWMRYAFQPRAAER
jgi:hypothetical protein